VQAINNCITFCASNSRFSQQCASYKLDYYYWPAYTKCRRQYCFARRASVVVYRLSASVTLHSAM